MLKTLEYNFIHYPCVEPLVTHTLLVGFVKVDEVNTDITGLLVFLAGIILPPIMVLLKTVIFALIMYTFCSYISAR